MSLMAKWQRLGSGGSAGMSRGAVSQWDNNSVPSPTLTSVGRSASEVPA